ncbi:MAG: polymer-forming cytoskeletal protein [Thermoanaerobaculia bacterium]|nr:polymer-forming cytoskeletal protein [Thermoanaerobaculia bacterium]
MSRRRGQLDGFLDAGSELHGDLRFRDTFRVEGKISGRVISEGELHVGEGGFVEAEVEVARLFVAGRLKGGVTASERIVIAPGGRLEGDIKTPCLLLEEGSIFEGYCQMSNDSAAESRPASVTRLR